MRFHQRKPSGADQPATAAAPTCKRAGVLRHASWVWQTWSDRGTKQAPSGVKPAGHLSLPAAPKTSSVSCNAGSAPTPSQPHRRRASSIGPAPASWVPLDALRWSYLHPGIRSSPLAMIVTMALMPTCLPSFLRQVLWIWLPLVPPLLGQQSDPLEGAETSK